MCARPPRRATRSCRITPTHEPKSVRIFAGAVATAHWPIATETIADDPDVPEEPEESTTHISRSVSFEFGQRGCQRVKRCTIGNEQERPVQVQLLRARREAGVNQEHLVELECLFHERELEKAAGEFTKERGRRGNQLIGCRTVARYLARKVRGQCIEIGAAYDVGGFLGGGLLELTPARRRADGLMHEQVHERQARAILEDQKHLTTQGSAQAHRTRGDQRLRRSQDLGRHGQFDQFDLADGEPNLLPEPLRERLRGALGSALEDHPEQPALSLTQNRFHQGRPPRKTGGPRKFGLRATTKQRKAVNDEKTRNDEEQDYESCEDKEPRNTRKKAINQRIIQRAIPSYSRSG